MKKRTKRKIVRISICVILALFIFSIIRTTNNVINEINDAKNNAQEFTQDTSDKAVSVGVKIWDVLVGNKSENNPLQDFVEDITNSEAYENETSETLTSELESVELVTVVDGDTILVKKDGSEIKIRMIGIDTPESVHSDESKNNEYGIMASNYTKEYLSPGMTLYLQYDIEQTDTYGRTLAYVWLSKDVSVDSIEDIKENMYNAILLKSGYAVNKEYEPNVMYADTFEEIRNIAESENAGLWQYDEYKTLVEGY